MIVTRAFIMATIALVPCVARAQLSDVLFDGGLVTLDCADVSLGAVFEQLVAKVGFELLLEDGVRAKRITAKLTNVPVPIAIQRLLDHTGVNYAVLIDAADWGRVRKVFIGAGGGGPDPGSPEGLAPPDEGASAGDMPVDPKLAPWSDASDVNGPPAPDEDELDDGELDDGELDDSDAAYEPPPAPEYREPEDLQNPANFPNPPSSFPAATYLPTPQPFPRSPATPGAPSASPRLTRPRPRR